MTRVAGIAVIIPCYNLGRTVEEALGSVRSQTRPAAEIVVVDDGSTDTYTCQRLARLERQWTRVARTPNRGVAAARNLGIRLTSAPYVVLLDADDILEPTYLEQAATRLDTRPDLDFVSCAIRAFQGASYVWSPGPPTVLQTLARGGPHISTMFRRAVWEAVGGFDESLVGYEDTDFWVSALERGCRGEVLEEPLLRHRVRPGSRYRRAIERTPYLATMTAIYRKHWATVQAHAPDLLLAKEAFLQDQRAHRRHLEDRAGRVSRELAELRAEVAGLATTLRQAGAEALVLGDLRRLTPLSPVWGLDRGKPVDRYFIEKFLARHQGDIRGRVLEVKDPGYTNAFGGGRVTRSDVIDIDPGNPRATIVADLTRADAVLSDTFDCFILTQTLHIIYDIGAALGHAYRMLRPGGVLLCTLPAVSRVSYEDAGPEGDYWRFTEAAIRELFAEVFPLEGFEVVSFGNVMTCAAFLMGLAAEELSVAELEHVDPWFPLVSCVRAVKLETTSGPGGREAWASSRPPAARGEAPTGRGAAILFYHRIAAIEPDPHGLCVRPDDFRSHMEHLHQAYVPIGLPELVVAVREGQRLPDRAVAVTLDDGYLDGLQTASEILSRWDIPATFFVTTDRLDEEHEFWWDTLERIFLSRAPIPATLELTVGGQTLRRPTVMAAERTAAHDLLSGLAYHASGDEREDLVRRVAVWSGLDLRPRASHRPMLAGEILALASRSGHAIGAHTVRHLRLPSQPRVAQEREVGECGRDLERLLGRPVPVFSYPYGELDEDTVQVVRSAAFEAAVTVEGRVVRPGDDPFRLPRFEVKSCDGAAFAERMRRILAGMSQPASP